MYMHTWILINEALAVLKLRAKNISDLPFEFGVGEDGKTSKVIVIMKDE